MKKLLLGIAVGLLLLSYADSSRAQLATQESTPLLVQSRTGAGVTPLAFTANVVSGHELIVAYECWNGGTCNTPPTVSDTLSTSWTSRVTQGSTTCGNLFILPNRNLGRLVA